MTGILIGVGVMVVAFVFVCICTLPLHKRISDLEDKIFPK